MIDLDLKVPFAYLDRQFDADRDLTKEIFDDLIALVASGDFTLGAPVLEFERRAKEYFGLNVHTGGVVGVHSGTAALILCLKALKIGPGDEVITVPNTFYATVGAIVEVGATPVFVDVDATYSMDVTKIQAAVTPRTKAIMPVHWYGMPADMDAIRKVANDNGGLAVIEDACASVGARYKGRPVGSIGDINAISLHPLKTLHVWGDGGAVLSNHAAWLGWLRQYRNHGMVGRDTIEIWGVNERLHSVQAVVANREFPLLEQWTQQRNAVARKLDAGLVGMPGVAVPPRYPDRLNAYQLYVVQCEDRDRLLPYLWEHGVDAKVHYPVPLHMQPAAATMRRERGIGPGSFPVAEAQAKRIVTLPCNQYLRDDEIDHIIRTMRNFYAPSRSAAVA